MAWDWFKDKIFSITFAIGWTGYDVSKDKERNSALADEERNQENNGGK